MIELIRKSKNILQLIAKYVKIKEPKQLEYPGLTLDFKEYDIISNVVYVEKVIYKINKDKIHTN